VTGGTLKLGRGDHGKDRGLVLVSSLLTREMKKKNKGFKPDSRDRGEGPR